VTGVQTCALPIWRDFPTQWSRFINPLTAAAGNVFELDMSTALFPARDTGKTVVINSIVLLARCTDPGTYAIAVTPPLPATPPSANTVALDVNAAYGGLHVGQRSTAADGVEVAPIGPPTTWRLTATRPGGGNLVVDPVTNLPEMQDLLMVVGYAWE